ncbi:MAG: PAS domain S-box protein [Acidobacteria bacterium]|nr:MAG: PAS domain S-box protein [Acidobacteriota bacterium]
MKRAPIPEKSGKAPAEEAHAGGRFAPPGGDGAAAGQLAPMPRQQPAPEPVTDISATLLDSANTFLCSVDCSGRVALFNRKCQELTGIAAEDAAGTELASLVAQRARPQIRDRIAAAFQGEALDNLELPLMGKDGGEVLLSVSSSLAGEGDSRRLLLVGTDITAAKRLQSNLAASERRSKSAYLQIREFSAVSSTILQEVDLDRICDLFVQALREHSNYGRAVLTLLNDEFRGHKWFFAGLSHEEIDIFHRSRLSGDQRVTIFQERFRMGNSYYIPHGSDFDYIGVPSHQETEESLDWHPEDFLFIPLYGSNRKMVGIVSVDDPQDGVRPTSETVSPIELFANQVAHAIEQARLNQAVRRTTEKYRTLVESMNDGLLVVDLANRITFVNPALRELLGQSEVVMLDQSIHRFLVREDREVFRAEVSQRERRARFEVRILPRSGDPIPVIVSSSPFFQNGQLVGTFAIVSDLREQKKAEAATVQMHGEIVQSNERLQQSVGELQTMQQQLIQAEKLSALGELISGVAHELNNPLTGVMGYSQLLLGEDCSDKIKRSLGKVHSEAIRCQKIVQNLLQFARRHKPEKCAVDINKVVEAALELRKYQLNVDNIEVIRELDERIPETTGDFHQLQQVFLNIINNAQQAMVGAHGRGRLILRTHLEGGEITVSFIDDGPGVPEDKINKIFDPFFTTKKPGQGTGLGLSLSYGIIQDHDGSIGVRSKYGEGTTFQVVLPVISPDLLKPQAAEEEALTPAPVGCRILVVDDERVILDLLATILETSGHRVDTASNGQRALEMLKKARYDLIISDMKMPDIGGEVLWESVHASDPDMAGRIIFSTGDTMNPATRAFFERTGNHYLAKPFRVEEVDQVVRKVLSDL